jgi:SAM-dependent methyltransferase
VGFRSACHRLYRTARSIIAPQLKYSQTIYESVLDAYTGKGKDWMDLGCGHQLLPPWRHEQEKRLAADASTLIGFDYDLAALRKHRTIVNRVCGDASNLPFRDGSFDLVSSNMVFEHLREPKEQMTEIFRVLRPDGRLIFHTPNALGYAVIIARVIPGRIKKKLACYLQDRKEEDVYPAFYRINSVSSIERLAVRIGFRVREIRLIVSTPDLVMIPPLVIFELLLIRVLMTRWLRPFRTNIIAILQKPAG